MALDSQAKTAVLGTLVVLGFIPALLLKAYYLTIIWSWFIVPAFGVAALNIPLVLGIGTFVGLFHYGFFTKLSREKHHGAVLGNMFLAPLFSLGIAWIIHLFV
jgi:hypothetical protein